MTNDNFSFVANSQQEEAINYDGGPLLVIAGAGTGKTSIITQKICHLILDQHCPPESLLALTYTDKAATEMEERVDKSIPYGYSRVNIFTFHAFADSILRQDGHHIGIPANYRLLTKADVIMLIKNNLFQLPMKQFRPMGNPNKFIEALYQHFSRLQDEDITPKQYTAWTKKQKKILTATDYEKQKELALLFSHYSLLKQKQDSLDFSDLLSYLLFLFRTRPGVLSGYQKKFNHVLVDEFQDTNIAQYSLLQLLCPSKKNPHLTVVGDDSQAIYKFRGASISNILHFTRDYPKAKIITFTANYRSYQEILDRSYLVITNNNPDTLESKLGISKKLTASRGKESDIVKVTITNTGEEEAESVTKKIKQLVKSGKYSYQDCAILYRAHHHSIPFVNALLSHAVPYQIVGSSALFLQPEIKELIAYLQFLSSLSDSAAWYRVLTMQLLAFDQEDVHSLLAFAKKSALSLYNVCILSIADEHPEWQKEKSEQYLSSIPPLLKDTKQKLSILITMVKRHIALASKESAGQIIYYFLVDTGYLKILGKYKTEKEERAAIAISQFFDLLKTLETIQADASIFSAVDYLKTTMELGESPLTKTQDLVRRDAVSLVSVHAAKGLEFPVVFIVNLSAARFPTRRRSETIPLPDALLKEIVPQGDYHLQEERRLFYVAVTRGKDKVFLTAARYYHEGKRLQKVSPFLIEMFPDEWQKWETQQKEQQWQMRLFENKNQEEMQAPLAAAPQKTFLRLSFSQIDTFLTCPKRYAYQYQIRIPTPETSTVSFGSSIHKALQLFYRQQMETGTGSLKHLLHYYDKSWIPFGYANREHVEETFNEGKKMLTQFYKKMHDKHSLPIALEQPFTLHLTPTVTISGVIDRIDQNDNTIEIIDYKTGRIPTEEELKKNKQLLVYGFAALKLPLLPIKPKKVILSYYYLADAKKISFEKTEEELEKIQPFLIDAAEQIQTSSFVPKKGIWCKFCPFLINCEAWQ